MTLTEKDGRWLCKKSPKAKTVEDVTDIIKFDGDFASLMGKAGRTEFHAYLHKSGNKWLQMYGVTSLLSYWGEKDKLVQWAVDKACDEVKAYISPQNFAFGLAELVDGSLDAVVEKARFAHKRSLNEASSLGTDVHAEVETYINKCIANGGKLPGMVFAGSEQSQLFQNWAEENDVIFLASEKVVYSKRLWCAGTLDFLCEIRGKLYVGDVKTSNWISPKHFLQCGAYASFYEEMGTTVDYAEGEGLNGSTWSAAKWEKGEPVEGIIIVNLPRSGGIKTVTNDNVGMTVDNLKRGFEDVVRLVKMDKDISSNLYM